MNDITSALAAIVADAMALLHDPDGTASPARIDCVERARRLRLAAETCHLTLAGPIPPVPATPRRPCTARTGKPALTYRELQVLRLIAVGLRDRQIADALLVSPRTVTSHVTAILNKLGAASRTAAVAHAIRTGLV